MPKHDFVFTSESVSEGHPDKVCDRISDAIVDTFLAAEPQARCGVETLATTNRVVLAGEVRGPASITGELMIEVARHAIREIGYEQEGFHWQRAADRLPHPRPVDRYRAGRRCRRQQGRGRRRSGHDVRLCLQRDARIHAGADLLRARDPALAGRCAAFRIGAAARARREKPGDAAICRRQAGRRDRGAGLDAARPGYRPGGGARDRAPACRQRRCRTAGCATRTISTSTRPGAS